MATVGEVLVKFGGDASQFQHTIGTMNIAFGTMIGNFLTKAAEFAISLPEKLIKAFTVPMGAIGELGKELTLISQKTGISVETLSALRIAAEEGGTSIDRVTVGLRNMQRSLANADDESKVMVKNFTELGFTTAQINTFMTDGEGFIEAFATKLAAIPTVAERTRVAMATLGRAGLDMLPLMLTLADRGLDSVKKEAAALGDVMTTKGAAAAKAYADNIAKLGFVLEGVKIKILGPLVQAFATLMDFFLKSDMFKSFETQMDKLAKSGVLEAWAKKVTLFLVSAFANAVQFIATSFKAIVAFGIAAFNGLMGAVSSFADMMFAAFNRVSGLLLNFLRGAEQSFVLKKLFGLENIQEAELLIGDFANAGEIAFSKLKKSADAAQITKVPEGLAAIETTLQNVATKADEFGKSFTKNFDQSNRSLTAAAGKSSELTADLESATTESGDIVKTSGGLVAVFDKATGKINLMNDALSLARNLIAEINANPLNPTGG